MAEYYNKKKKRRRLQDPQVLTLLISEAGLYQLLNACVASDSVTAKEALRVSIYTAPMLNMVTILANVKCKKVSISGICILILFCCRTKEEVHGSGRR